MTTFYVSSYAIHRGKRWTWGIGTTTDRAAALLDASIARGTAYVYEVEAPTKGEAAAVVFRWLALGMPPSMTVSMWPPLPDPVPR